MTVGTKRAEAVASEIRNDWTKEFSEIGIQLPSELDLLISDYEKVLSEVKEVVVTGTKHSRFDRTTIKTGRESQLALALGIKIERIGCELYNKACK